MAAAVLVSTVVIVRTTNEDPGPPAETVEVFVAVEPRPAGHVLGPDDVQRVHYPAVLAPTSATGEPVGRVLLTSIGVGEIVAETRLLATDLAPDRRVVRLAAHVETPILRPGDRVDVVGVRLDGFGAIERRRIVVDATVLEVADDDRGPSLVVGPDEDLEIAEWIATGTLSVTRRP